MKIPFVKAHGAGNDFLFTFSSELPPNADHPAIARALCHRRTGVGADGWYVIDRPTPGADAKVRLWNSDGSYAELSGNGTRCAAAILVAHQHVGPALTIETGSGLRSLRLLDQQGESMRFEMNVGEPRTNSGTGRFLLPVRSSLLDVTLLDVGNPQCAVPVDAIDPDWQALGAQIEAHPHFPRRTNVSFFTSIDPSTINARFFERGAGPTLSSGTGATGAAAAAILRGLATSPVTVRTEDAPLTVRWDGPGHPAFLIGPAQVVATGIFQLP